MAWVQLGMVEIIRFVMRHAELFHNPARAGIGGDCEGDNLRKTELGETEIKRGIGRLRRIALTPIIFGDAPADFHARGKMRGETRHDETCKPDEGGNAGQFDGPEGEAAFGLVLPDARGLTIALCRAQRAGKEFADMRIGIEGAEGRKILIPPRAQQ